MRSRLSATSLRVVAAGAASLAMLSSVTLLAPTSASAAVTTVNGVSSHTPELVMNAPGAATALTARFTLSVPSKTTLSQLRLSLRSASVPGAAYDTSTLYNVTFNGSKTFTFLPKVPDGTWTAAPLWNKGGTWSTGAKITFTQKDGWLRVGAATTTATPTASPSTTSTTPAPTASPTTTGTATASPTATATATASTAPSPTATSATEPLAAHDARLSWAPPALVNPVDLHVKQGTRRLFLTTGVDYRIHLPKSEPLVITNDFQIIGGRNVVLIGGEIRFTTAGRMIYIKGIAGQTAPRTVHIEGLKVGAVGDNDNLMTEGVNIDSQDEPHLTVRFQNYHQANRVNGYYKNADGTMGPHADIFQYWNGPYALQLDRVYGATNYQGVMHQAASFGYPATYGQYVFRRTWFYGPDSGSMMYMKYDRTNMAAPVIDRFYITPNPKKAYPSQTLYGLEDRVAEFTRLTSRDARPDIPILTGNPGLGYVSPGYAPTS